MMRNKLGIVFITAALFITPHLTAADAPKNALSFSFSTGDNTIAYRRSFGMFAGLISAGYSKYSFETSESTGTHDKESAHAWTLGAGLRRYIATKTPLQPFLQLDVSRATPGGSFVVAVGACGESHYNTASLTSGAEYHFTPAISIEGRAGITGTKATSRCSSSDFSYRDDSRTLGTFRSAVALNFYF